MNEGDRVHDELDLVETDRFAAFITRSVMATGSNGAVGDWARTSDGALAL